MREGAAVAGPGVDIVIATVGRPTLAAAIASALVQTRPARLVVIADDNEAQALHTYDHVRVSIPGADTIFRRTPERFGRGDAVKRWYLQQDWAAPFCKFLDDDDYMMPVAIERLMAGMTDGVVAVTCQMVVVVQTNGRYVRHRTASGKLAPGQIGGDSVLVRTAEAKEAVWPDGLDADFHWLAHLSARGRFVHLPIPLYVYNGWRTNKERP